MFTALTLSLAIGAPVPQQTAPVATGIAPQVMELKPNSDGKIVVVVTRTEMQKVPVPTGAAIRPNGARQAVFEREVQVTKHMTVPLGDVKDLTITTADGKKLDVAEALKKLEKGEIVVVSTDGNPVSPAFLKVFKDDTLVLTAKEMAGTRISGMTRPSVGTQPAIQPGFQILPANPGGVIQLQIQQGAVQVVPIQGNAQVLPVPVARPVPVKPAVPPKPNK